MKQKNLSLTLAKVMIAAAWADGEVQPEELECLKRFILDLPDIDHNDWGHLDVYISMPIDEDERYQLIEDLKDLVRNEEDKQFVFHALEVVFKADGIISKEESRTIDQVNKMLNT